MFKFDPFSLSTATGLQHQPVPWGSGQWQRPGAHGGAGSASDTRTVGSLRETFTVTLVPAGCGSKRGGPREELETHRCCQWQAECHGSLRGSEEG